MFVANYKNHILAIALAGVFFYGHWALANINQVRALKKILICGPRILLAPDDLNPSTLQQSTLLSVINKFRMGGADIIDPKIAYKFAVMLTGKSTTRNSNSPVRTTEKESFTKQLSKMTPEQRKKIAGKRGLIAVMRQHREMEKKANLMAERMGPSELGKKNQLSWDKNNSLVTSLCPKESDKSDKNVANAQFFKLMAKVKAESFMIVDAAFRVKNAEPKAGEAYLTVAYYDQRGQFIWKSADGNIAENADYLSGSAISAKNTLLNSATEAAAKMIDALRVQIYK